MVNILLLILDQQLVCFRGVLSSSLGRYPRILPANLLQPVNYHSYVIFSFRRELFLLLSRFCPNTMLVTSTSLPPDTILRDPRTILRSGSHDYAPHKQFSSQLQYRDFLCKYLNQVLSPASIWKFLPHGHYHFALSLSSDQYSYLLIIISVGTVELSMCVLYNHTHIKPQCFINFVHLSRLSSLTKFPCSCLLSLAAPIFPFQPTVRTLFPSKNVRSYPYSAGSTSKSYFQ